MPLSGPDQFLAEGCQGGALAAMRFHQRHAEEGGPLLDQVPDMPVGQIGMFGGRW